MPLPLRNVAALLIVIAASVASIVAWGIGPVTLGVELGEVVDGQVNVTDVTPDGNAAWRDWHRGLRVLDLTTVDGSEVERNEPVLTDPEAILWPEPAGFNPIGSLLGNVGGPPGAAETVVRPPTEPVDESLIQTAVGGDVANEPSRIAIVYATLDRTLFELELRSSIWILAFGAVLGTVLWRLLRHGVAGAAGRDHAVVLGCAAAAPFLVMPLVESGATPGIVAGSVVPGGVAVVLGLSIAGRHPERSWAQSASAGTLLAAGLAVLLLVRHMTTPVLGTTDRGGVLLVLAAIAVIPALVAFTAEGRTMRERLGLVSLSLVPGAALNLIGPRPDILVTTILIGILVGWQVLPVDRLGPAIGQRLPAIEADTEPAPSLPVGGVSPFFRDLLGLSLLLGIVLLALVAAPDHAAIVAALAAAGLVWLTVRQGFLGPAWTDAAVPLAVAVGVPVALNAFGRDGFDSGAAWVLTSTAAAALPVAHVLATRYPDRVLAGRLLLGSVAVALVVLVSSVVNVPEVAVILVACVALVPGIPLAFARSADDASGVSTRLHTMAVALTPAAAALMLLDFGAVLFAAWLAALVIWRYFTITPLVRFAQRSQLQRDVAVAAAETERARLAADLHDDALQQLTMLVRTLDERGDKETADQAREIADKLRAVVGDLRLPILDDLGAGAALEWLVERVEPLAGGSVKLERSDETRPPATVELAVFRVAQEALTNAIKHGRPPIAIRYDVRTDGRVTLAIDDAGDGIGADAADEAPRDGHFGLVNMQQRAEQIGALLDVRRWPGGGTRVALEWRPQ